MNLADKEKCNLYKELRGLKRVIEQSHGRLAKYRVCEAQTVFHQHAINLSMILQNQVGLQILINIIALYIFKKLYKKFLVPGSTHAFSTWYVSYLFVIRMYNRCRKMYSLLIYPNYYISILMVIDGLH